MGTDRTVVLRPVFAEVVPDPHLMEDDVLYVSIVYATAIHKCACGCGHQAVTPLSPEEWSLTYNGEAISLRPSIGNWGMTCRSHYWIQDNRIIWVPEEKRRRLVSLLRSALQLCRLRVRPQDIDAGRSLGSMIRAQSSHRDTTIARLREARVRRGTLSNPPRRKP